MSFDRVLGFEYDKCWDYENGFYLTSSPKRLSKSIAHWELYKRIIDLPGHVVECGVFKGASFVRFLTYRGMLENSSSRKIIGFDAFGKFPEVGDKDDAEFIERFEGAGGYGVQKEEFEQALTKKGFDNYELIRGDVFDTIPVYLESHPELRISLLHIDVDVYEPSKFILETLYDRVVKGGVVILDDYATVAGETRAVDEFFENKNLVIEKLPLSHIPAFVIKR